MSRGNESKIKDNESKIDTKNKKGKKCFVCGKKIWDDSSGDESWTKRTINGKWDGKNYFCNICGDKSEEPLSDKEKLILFSMIAARAFSQKSTVDLLKDEIVRNKWKEVIDVSYKKLKELHLIEIPLNEIYDNSGIEHPIANLFRNNTSRLQRKTKGLFKRGGNMIFFLDVFRRANVSKDDISSLMKLIAGKKILNDLDDVCDFLINVSHENHIFIFDPHDHIFSRPEYDNIMKDIILYFYPSS